MDYEAIKNFPKIDLHRHLEGCFYPEVLYEKAQLNQLGFPTKYEDFLETLRFPKDSPPNFLVFLSKFYNKWYGTLTDVEDVVYQSLKHIDTADNLFYLELRFNPYHYCINKGFDPVETLNVVLNAANAAKKKLNFPVKYLLTFNRGLQKEDEMLEMLKKFQKQADFSEVVGIDLAGDEIHYPPENFTKFFSYVHDAGLAATIHAGEVSPSDQIWTAIKELHAKRIGHGVSVITDKELQKFTKDQQIAFEMAPTSNYQTNAWADYKTHPIRQLFDNGLLVTLNSDDPTVQGQTLNDDYQKVVTYLNFTKEELLKLNLNSIEASFLPAAEKEALKQAYLKKVAL